MPNSLGNIADKMTQRLDRIISAETKTADLNMNSDLLGEFNNAGKIEIAKIALQGLGDYDRKNGFAQGDITLEWEPYELRFDRGRQFSVDDMDDEERLRVVSANIMAEFERTRVIPEVDAVRFATLAENAGSVDTTTFNTDADVASKMSEMEEAMEDTGADLSQVILYCTSAVKGSLRRETPHKFGAGEDPDTRFQTYDGMKVVTVPSERFLSKIDVLDGITGDELAGGYKKAADGVGINFLLVNPDAAAAIQKHQTLRYFAPAVNQDADAHKWQYRLYHDLLVYENKKKYIMASVKAAS